MSIVGTTPKRTRGGLTKHSSFGHVARPTLHPDDHGTSMQYTPPLSGCLVWTQWLASQTRVLTAFRGQSLFILPKACSTLDHFKRPATTCPAPPAEQKDKDDHKSSLQQSLIAPIGYWWLCHPLSTIMTAKNSSHHSKGQCSWHYKRPPPSQRR